MFTGLIRCIGVVKSIRNGRDSRIITIKHSFPDIPLQGASIAVQGVCLTVLESADKTQFIAECHYASLKKSNLQYCRPGDRVHLEPAMTLGSAVDGHLVQGHVSAMAAVKRNSLAGSGRTLTLELPDKLRQEICSEGSVALNGVSLTVESLDTNSFSIQLIGETLRSSCLADLKTGDKVNVEGDLLLRQRAEVSVAGEGITEQKLLQWGYV